MSDGEGYSVVPDVALGWDVCLREGRRCVVHVGAGEESGMC